MSSEKSETQKDTVGKSIVFTYIFSVFSAVTGFLIIVVLSWLLSPEEWGVFSVAKRTGTLISTVALIGITVSMTRYIPMERARKSIYADYYGTNAVFIVSIASITVAVIWLLVLFFIGRLFIQDEILLLALYAASFFFLALMWQLLITSFLRAEGYIRQFNMMTLTGQVFQLIFSTIAIVIIGSRAIYAILGSSIGILMVVIISSVFLIRLGVAFFQREYLNRKIQREMISYGLPRMGMGILEILLVSFSLLLLGFKGNTYEAGLFAIALQFIAILQLIFQPITIVMLPEFSKLHGLEDIRGTETKIQVLIQGWLYIILFALIMLLAFINPVFQLIFKVDYMSAVGLLKILCIGVVPFSFYLTTYSYINAVAKKPYVLFILFIGIVINVVMFSILVPALGGTGAAIATSGGMVAVGIMMSILLLKFQPRAFGAIHISDFILCTAPIAGILVAGSVVDNMGLLLIITIMLIGIYFKILKYRRVSWFLIVEKNLLSGYSKG